MTTLTTNANTSSTEKFRNLYIDTLKARIADGANPGTKLESLLRAADALPIFERRSGTGDHGHIRVWSDLHLGDKGAIDRHRRPFRHIETMNEALLHAWRAGVAAGDTLLNGGDTALADALTEPLRRAIREAPGQLKILIAGEEECNGNGLVPDSCGHTDTLLAMLLDTDPRMVLTHVPLNAVPDGWVNLHGHTHGEHHDADSRHINICIEQTAYRPVRLSELIVLAKHLLTHGAPKGKTTRDRIKAAKRLRRRG